jgi:Tfp pilus assembly protein PilX
MSRASKRGVILAVVVMVMLALSLIGVGMMSLGTTDSIETTRNSQRSRAFWIAEAGLNKTASRLVDEAFFRDGISRSSANPYQATETCGDGSFAVGVYRGAINTAASNDFFITSVGSLRQESKTVSQVATINPDGYQMPFYSNAITAWNGVFYNNVVVDGPVSIPSNNVTIHGGGTYDIKFPPDRPPPLDTTEYDSLIGYAASAGTPATNGTINLGGGTVYIRGNFNLSSVTGPGTIVASGTVDFGQGSTSGAGVTIIAGNQLIFGENTSIGSNSLLYASAGVEFKAKGVGIDNSALMTPGKIVAKAKFNFDGIMYSGGGLEIKNGGEIRGVIVSGGGDVAMNTEVSLKNDVHVTFDPGALPPSPPPGLGGTTLIRSQWQES